MDSVLKGRLSLSNDIKAGSTRSAKNAQNDAEFERLFGMDSKYLNSEFELRKIFGSKVLNMERGYVTGCNVSLCLCLVIHDSLMFDVGTGRELKDAWRGAFSFNLKTRGLQPAAQVGITNFMRMRDVYL